MNQTLGTVMSTVQAFRDFFAKFIVANVGSSEKRLIDAFAAIERERFVGPGPWSIFTESGYISTTTDDPRMLYQDILIGLAPERTINNGQPSLHALCLAAVETKSGESVVHIGAGTGYYTAVLAQLVGPSGTIHAYEIERDLAVQAAANLADLPGVHVHCASGADSPLPTTDVIYVNAGTTHPLDAWLDALVIGGRLIFPLTPNEGLGGMLLVTRVAAAEFAAKFVSRAMFIPCTGARDESTSQMLVTAFGTRNIRDVRSLRRDATPDDTAWCVGSGWWLSTTV